MALPEGVINGAFAETAVVSFFSLIPPHPLLKSFSPYTDISE